MEFAMSCLTGRDEEVASVVEAKVEVEAREEDQQQAMETDWKTKRNANQPPARGKTMINELGKDSSIQSTQLVALLSANIFIDDLQMGILGGTVRACAQRAMEDKQIGFVA